MTFRKGVDLLVNVVPYVCRRCPNVEFVIGTNWAGERGSSRSPFLWPFRWRWAQTSCPWRNERQISFTYTNSINRHVSLWNPFFLNPFFLSVVSSQGVFDMMMFLLYCKVVMYFWTVHWPKHFVSLLLVSDIFDLSFNNQICCVGLQKLRVVVWESLRLMLVVYPKSFLLH